MATTATNILVPSASSLSSETREYDLSALCDAFLTACRESNTEEIQTSLAELRKAILFQGVEDDAKEFDPAVCTLRGKIWKAMLGLGPVDANFYMSLIDKGTSIKYDKIRGDSFRTFPDDKIFTDRVPEPRLIRVLNSFTHVYAGKDSPFSYRQGMNAICAPLLWCMPEVDAYYAFSKLITERFPLYWTNDVVGAEAGCKLVDQCLQLLDPELHQHLKENGELVAYVYAFSCVSSLSASVRPFEELIFLWDFLLAFGPHLNVVCVAAQVILMRDQLLKTSTPKNLLDYRKWPPLRARVIIHMTMSLLPRIPADLFDRICRHATDPAVCAEIVGRPVKYTPFKHQA